MKHLLIIGLLVTGVWSAAASANKKNILPAIPVVKWTDPLERAFSVEVPRGWDVKGGLIRRNATDPRACLTLTAQDGTVQISLGDARVPVYVVPGFSPFFGEGADYSPGYGVAMKVGRYRTGADFAREYATAAGPVQILAVRDRTDVATAINSLQPGGGSGYVSVSTSCGEVEFLATMEGRPMTGYCFTSTELTSSRTAGAPGGMWRVPHILRCLMVPGYERVASMVVGHLLRTSRVDPEWFERNLENGRAIAEIVNQTNRQISAIINRGTAGRNAGEGALSEARRQATMGEEEWEDAEGQRYVAPNQYEHIWKLPNGKFCATPDSDPPEPGAQKLVLKRSVFD